MNRKPLIFLKNFSVFLVVIGFHGVVSAVQAPNPRSVTATPSATTRGENTVTKDVSRSTTARRSTISRNVSEQPGGTVTNRAAARQTVYVNNRPEVSVSRSATARSAQNMPSARSATVQPGAVSRAARATAVFDDVSKIGGGYATCREAYNTCMDQFCAKSSDTYRRCYCSSKITEFRDTEAALDQAKTLLMQFQDNNLNAVDKTASEVTAMYSATIGEQAIKNDPSAAANTLSQISDLLSGKTKATTNKSVSSSSLDFSSDLGDIWGGNGSADSSFGFGTNQDLASLEGSSLFSAASKQCLQLVKDSCENNAVLTMAQSSYNILITQDCNTYQKKLDTQKQAVETTVRDAEKILRDARLEEYRSHNSADVNACISNVKAAITSDMACGANYKKCLDYTGSYIDVNTGDPIYSPQLFKLTGIITLNATNGDVVTSNPKFSKFLDDKKIFAEKALDSCRDKATVVWDEFKRSAIIEIAQAQDSKIEEVKDSCVSTMKQCYDTQSGALASFDNTAAQATGALNAYAARQMCADKVSACAALYATSAEQKVCNFDKDGRLTNASQCGMAALLTFVQTVDNVKVAEGCETSLTNYLKDVCTPTAGDQGYPYACRSKTSSEINKMLYARADVYCIDPTTKKVDDTLVGESITNLVNDVSDQVESQLGDACEALDGYWQDANNTVGTSLKAFYSNTYGGTENNAWGRCVQNDVMVRCLANNTDTTTVASYDKAKDECTFTDDWYKTQCGLLGNGYYENGICYVGK